MHRILVTGALGQIGTELIPVLCARHGPDRVLASDIRPQSGSAESPVPFETLDVTDPGRLEALIRRQGIETIYHLAALLSVRAEDAPQTAWTVNMGGTHAVLEAARRNGCAVFLPSSIAAFGPSSPRRDTPQLTVQRPTTIYGVTKVAGELLADYYVHRFGIDCRGLRLPGLISHAAPPGGGTTDYAVAMFHAALAPERHYRCYLAPETRLDMMYMPDALGAIMDLMAADPARLNHRNAYNLAAISLTPEDLASSIRRHIPDFTVTYDIDPARQAIADSWPQAVDDSAARQDWGWQALWDLEAMTRDMLQSLSRRGGLLQQPVEPSP